MFEHRGSFRCCARCVCGDLTMRCREPVRTRNIPCDTSAHFPRNQRHSVCSLFIVQEQTGRFLGSRDPGSDARTEDYVIQHIMSTRAPSTPPARQSMDAQGIHQRTAGAAVWSTQIHAEPQTNCHSNSLVIQPQAARRDWHSVQPVTAMRCLCGQEAGLADVIGA